MRIAFLYSANSPYVNTRIKYLLSHGHEVYYFAQPSPISQSVPSRVNVVPIRRSSLRKVKYLRMFTNVYTIRKLTQKYQLDIFHIRGMGNSIHVPFSKSKKVVIDNTGSDVLVGPPTKYPRVVRVIYKVAYRFADAIVQDSKVSQDAGIRYGAPILNNEIVQIGVDFNVFNLNVKPGVARKHLGITSNQKFVFCSRGFQDVYNVDILIKTIPFVKKTFPDVKYVVCSLYQGLEEQYKQLANELNVLDNTIFAGSLDNEKELPFFCKDADVVVSVPSSDSSPLSVYEAMACGTPVIVSELPWYLQKFENGRDLLAVPVRNVEKLASAILDIIGGRKTLDVRSSYKKVFESMNMEVENRKLERLYCQILDE